MYSSKMLSNNPIPLTTQTCLLAAVNEYLELHPEMTAESFGWYAVQDSSIVARLRKGGDVTTRKLDKILAFIHHHKIGVYNGTPKENRT